MDKLISLESVVETFKDCAENGMSIDGIVDALEQLPSAQPEQRWIPCSEDFPKVKQKVLVQYADGSMATKRCNDAGHLQWFYANAVAWMPAPEPWKGDAE